MDIDKITKLIRLANNNPNENEANLAARKACKIIEENNFPFTGGTSQKPKDDPFRRASNTWGTYDKCSKCGAERVFGICFICERAKYEKEYEKENQYTPPKQESEYEKVYDDSTKCPRCGSYSVGQTIVSNDLWVCKNCHYSFKVKSKTTWEDKKKTARCRTCGFEDFLGINFDPKCANCGNIRDQDPKDKTNQSKGTVCPRCEYDQIEYSPYYSIYRCPRCQFNWPNETSKSKGYATCPECKSNNVAYNGVTQTFQCQSCAKRWKYSASDHRRRGYRSPFTDTDWGF